MCDRLTPLPVKKVPEPGTASALLMGGVFGSLYLNNGRSQQPDCHAETSYSYGCENRMLALLHIEAARANPSLVGSPFVHTITSPM
ncbi:PEP-CTERM sorting domain-containing protein [Tolypothrix campylonemoides VB511288]|nr:PEP-CTERM sorting domain-containing protein [Tolypothrix campylonemoides VB511288]